MLFTPSALRPPYIARGRPQPLSSKGRKTFQASQTDSLRKSGLVRLTTEGHKLHHVDLSKDSECDLFDGRGPSSSEEEGKGVAVTGGRHFPWVREYACYRISPCLFFSNPSYPHKTDVLLPGGRLLMTFEFVGPFEERSAIRKHIHFRNLKFGSGHRKKRGRRCGWIDRSDIIIR